MEYCYAVCLSNGVIKFGRTIDLHTRLASHVSAAAAMGVICMCALVSGSTDCVSDERKMLEWANALLKPQNHGREYFKGTPEDALQVMLHAGLLPVPAHAVKDTSVGGLRFVVAQMGGIFEGYRLVKPSKVSEPRHRIMQALKGGTLGIGLLRNKARGLEPDIFDKSLAAMVEDGSVKVSETTHPVNKRVTKRYSLS